MFFKDVSLGDFKELAIDECLDYLGKHLIFLKMRVKIWNILAAYNFTKNEGPIKSF